MNTQTIKIPNFKLSIFRNLLEQSLIVNSQLMLEFSSELIKSCSFSSTQSIMKLWTVPLSDLVENKSDNELNLEPKEFKIDIPTFDFYILKGNMFNSYFSVHNSDTVDLEFELVKTNDKWQARTMKISSILETSPLETGFELTTEEFITNKIDDYSEPIKKCTPSDDMFEFILTAKQIQEIKRLIKNLHKSNATNTAFLTFTIDVVNKKICVNDKVFNIGFLIASQSENIFKLPNENFRFNIMKSDFIMLGNHTFSFYTNNESQKVIMGTKFANSIIWCLSSKIAEQSLSSMSDSILDSSLESVDLSEYGLDDLPF